jgi:hypothetical protein
LKREFVYGPTFSSSALTPGWSPFVDGSLWLGCWATPASVTDMLADADAAI